MADLLPETPTFLDDLTPDSGLSLRRWTLGEYHRMAYPIIFGPEERTELIHGEIMVFGEGVPRLFNREEYYRLAKYGILQPDERTELIYGRVIKRMGPMGEPHSISIMKTADALEDAFGPGWVVRQQLSLRLNSGLEPEPDVLVVPGVPDDYADVPISSVALLLVEVSDTTLRYDRGTKAAMYATDSVPDYWLINLRYRTLEVRRQPENGEYLSLDVYGEQESIAPLAAPRSPVRVAALLPLTRPQAS
ncbi:MAG: Uma2 family endonuclease [Armatimonadetes bacterium]|nr:Uma2 family endonuclease [Armatimonadota bacterium]